MRINIGCGISTVRRNRSTALSSLVKKKKNTTKKKKKNMREFQVSRIKRK